MGNKRHLRLVASNPDPVPSLSPRLRSFSPVPDSDRDLVKKLRDYTDRLVEQIEFDFEDKSGLEAKSEDGVLQAIYCLSPHRALELTKELNLIAYLSASRELSLAAKSKLAEADYVI